MFLWGLLYFYYIHLICNLKLIFSWISCSESVSLDSQKLWKSIAMSLNSSQGFRQIAKQRTMSRQCFELLQLLLRQRRFSWMTVLQIWWNWSVASKLLFSTAVNLNVIESGFAVWTIICCTSCVLREISSKNSFVCFKSKSINCRIFTNSYNYNQNKTLRSSPGTCPTNRCRSSPTSSSPTAY